MSDEPLTESQCDRIVIELLTASRLLQTNDPICLKAATLGGWCCSYHDGYLDGIDAALDRLKNGPADA
jgi:hypothetical protein